MKKVACSNYTWFLFAYLQVYAGGLCFQSIVCYGVLTIGCSRYLLAALSFFHVTQFLYVSSYSASTWLTNGWYY